MDVGFKKKMNKGPEKNQTCAGHVSSKATSWCGEYRKKLFCSSIQWRSLVFLSQKKHKKTTSYTLNLCCKFEPSGSSTAHGWIRAKAPLPVIPEINKKTKQGGGGSSSRLVYVWLLWTGGWVVRVAWVAEWNKVPSRVLPTAGTLIVYPYFGQIAPSHLWEKHAHIVCPATMWPDFPKLSVMDR